MNKKIIYLGVLIFISIFACEELEREFPPKLTYKIAHFESIDTTTIPADSVSKIQLIVALHEEADTAYRTVKFTTDKGFFSNGTQEISKTVNSEKKATITLTSGIEEGDVKVQASVGTVIIETTLEFVKAMPDLLQLDPKLATTSNQDIKLGIKLLRNEGRVGNDIKVDLSYVPLDTTNVLLNVQSFVFIENEFDSISISNPLNIKGRFEIIIKVQNQQADTVSTSSQIIFQ